MFIATYLIIDADNVVNHELESNVFKTEKDAISWGEKKLELFFNNCDETVTINEIERTEGFERTEDGFELWDAEFCMLFKFSCKEVEI